MKANTDIKTLIEVYDPAMCCSTGVCGPDVDNAVANFAHDVKWLKSQGIDVRRYNLGQEPEAFKMNPEVLSRLQKKGTECLPLLLVNGQLVSEGDYPDPKQLAVWLGIAPEHTDEAVISSDLLSDLEAAVTDGNEENMRTLFQKGKENGFSTELMVDAMQKEIKTARV